MFLFFAFLAIIFGSSAKWISGWIFLYLLLEN